ncbi:MAG TPA: peptide deformylase [Candidatus Dojkabacteria bacterium]|nr:peptide deformylase [Candidatus Dojkabacteria bacterium]
MKIYTIDNKNEEKFLREPSEDVTLDELKSKDLKIFLGEFLHTAKTVMTQEGYSAAGLAAVQVGLHKNIFCILKEGTQEFEVMINPSIKVIKDEKIIDTEGCLSVPKREGKVERYKKIKVKYLDRDGKIKKGVFSNQEAREIQHEYDHTKGVLFIDKLID